MRSLATNNEPFHRPTRVADRERINCEEHLRRRRKQEEGHRPTAEPDLALVVPPVNHVLPIS
jgi:hypothetical protein